MEAFYPKLLESQAIDLSRVSYMLTSHGGLSPRLLRGWRMLGPRGSHTVEEVNEHFPEGVRSIHHQPVARAADVAGG